MQAVPDARSPRSALTTPGSTSRRCRMAAWRSPAPTPCSSAAGGIDGAALLGGRASRATGQFAYLRAARSCHARGGMAQGRSGPRTARRG